MAFIADGPAGRASPAGFLNADRRRPDAGVKGPQTGVEGRLNGALQARRAVVKPGVKNSNYRVSRRNRIAPRPDDHGRHSGVPRAAPVIIPPRPFPGSNGLTVARSSSPGSNPAMAAAFFRRRTGNPNERRENDEPGSRPDGNSDWLLSHASYRSETPSPYCGSTSSNSAQGWPQTDS